MLWNELLRKGNYSLLQSKSDTQYCVCSNYDETAEENRQYCNGTYFCYWGDSEQKAYFLSTAIECFREKTEKDYITRFRLEEIATKSLHAMKQWTEDTGVNYFEEGLDLEEHEIECFGLNMGE